jgi:hypothetical protein
VDYIVELNYDMIYKEVATSSLQRTLKLHI